MTGLGTLPFILMMTTGSTYAVSLPDVAPASDELRPGRQLACYAIRHGDSAARLAERFTGNPRNMQQPWFQIVNPATATFIPKSDYGVIQSGWQVCVAPERLRDSYSQARNLVVPPPSPATRQTRITQQRPAIDLSIVWWATPLFAIASTVVLARIVMRRVDDRRVNLAIMESYGLRFIAEFERPLFRRSAAAPAIRARLRFSPSRHRVEVLLAPADGRTYPNLVDHRRNVEYDVERVQQVLRDESFTNGPLYAERSWVVIPFYFDTSQLEGGS
jgi:hypothetical protein